GRADYGRLRPRSYPGQMSLSRVSVGSPKSFQNIKDKWFPEMHHHCPGVPCVMVATQIDLRSDKKALDKMAALGQLPVPTDQSLRMARELGAAKYLESSAKTQQGVKDVFGQVSTSSTAFSECWPL
ncbi:P-loop containing nucleoside triphosphate hydrolase protein, partial [Mycena leptocephala]